MTETSQLLQYADMQRTFYEREAKRDPEQQVVGCYDYHENVPYETNLLYLYGDIRKPIFTDFGNRTAFDFACGEGRMVRRMRRFFDKVDGADLSETMIDLARKRTPGSDFWVTDGMSTGAAPSAAYDFCYCTISMQHICVFETRDRILRDMCRILKPDGQITLQYLYSRAYPALPVTPVRSVSPDHSVQLFRNDKHHAKWFENKTDAVSTNSDCDVVIGPGELEIVYNYFRLYFELVDFWFYDISIGRDGLGQTRILPHIHPNSHISDEYHGTHFVYIHCAGKKYGG